MFEKRDILYNEYSRDYHNKNKRKEVIMKIGQEVQMTGIYTAHYVLVGMSRPKSDESFCLITRKSVYKVY